MKKNNRSFWLTMWPYLKEYKGKMITCVVCALLVGVFVAWQPFVIKYIVDSGISNESLAPNEKMQTVFSLCILYIIISLLRLSIWRFGAVRMFQILEKSLLNLRSKFFHHIQTLGMSFYENYSSGDLFNCIFGTPMVNIKSYMSLILMSVPYQALSLVISISALLYYEWSLTLVLFITALVMALFNKLARKKIKQVSSDYIKSEADASKYVHDTLNGMNAIKQYSIEDDIYDTFSTRLENICDKGITFSSKQHKEQILPEMIQYLGTAVIYFVGAIVCVYKGISVGVLYAFLSSMTSILSILISWLNIGLTKSSADAGLEKIMSVLETRTDVDELDPSRARSIEVEKNSAKSKNKPCISFKDVTFSYPNQTVLTNFNCDIRYGESIALVGSSGCGKSTISKLAMRLYDVQEGEVLLHGKNVKDYSIHDLRVSFGIVPQNPYIFSGSIWENVSIACPTASNREIINAMEIAHVHEFVNNLEYGWNTIVGDGGLDLSGGQKQRIAIARAVLGSPDILIFDEATSALDNISEQIISDSINKLMKDHTVIIIAHRLSTIKNVDRILVMEKGTIVEEGSYEKLSKKEDGKFYEFLHI